MENAYSERRYHLAQKRRNFPDDRDRMLEELKRHGKIFRETGRAILVEIPLWGTLWILRTWMNRIEPSSSHKYSVIVFHSLNEILKNALFEAAHYLTSSDTKI